MVGALAGLVPWALVAGGIRVPPWLFLLLAVPPGLLIVAADNNPGGMFPLMIAIVWLILTAPSMWLPAIAAGAAFLAILECTIDKGSMDDSGIVYFTGGLGIAWLSGWLLRRQAALMAQIEAMREAQAEQAAATERARIAREVHDVVAHSLTVVMLSLTGARRALATDPARADEALARAELVGRDSLDSIRQVMGLLRDPESTAPRPQPTLEGIPHLVDEYRGAGLEVELTIERDRGARPDGRARRLPRRPGVVGERAAARTWRGGDGDVGRRPRRRRGRDHQRSGHPNGAVERRTRRPRHARHGGAGARRRRHVRGRCVAAPVAGWCRRGCPPGRAPPAAPLARSAHHG